MDMCQKVHGNPNPGPTDNHTLGRFSSLAFYQKALYRTTPLFTLASTRSKKDVNVSGCEPVGTYELTTRHHTHKKAKHDASIKILRPHALAKVCERLMAKASQPLPVSTTQWTGHNQQSARNHQYVSIASCRIRDVIAANF
jgi:hypothetical protein